MQPVPWWSRPSLLRGGDVSRLLVVGCGPKAAALAAKRAALIELGFQTPELVIVEQHHPGANWDGTTGYTDGALRLGTTPFEDVGFPYNSHFGAAVDAAMLRYSFVAFLIQSGTYVEWVDRAQPPPPHRHLAAYIDWVIQQSGATVRQATVTDIKRGVDEWQVHCETLDGSYTVAADGVVFTGPGPPLRFRHVDVSEEAQSRIRNGQDFWLDSERFIGLQDARIAVIGGGETSAAIVTLLASILGRGSQVEIVVRHPVLLMRNEHWQEVMYFSQPDNWDQLSLDERVEVLHTADRGTYSVAAMSALDLADNVTFQRGEVAAITGAGHCLALLTTGDGAALGPYDFVVEATGFDNQDCLSMIAAQSSLPVDPGPLPIDRDLSIKGLEPKVHLPNLAALDQGPGFPNLSCLGLLADRILTPYVGPSGQIVTTLDGAKS